MLGLIWALILASLFNTTVTTMIYGVFGAFLVIWLVRACLIVAGLIWLFRVKKQRCPNHDR